MRGRLARLYLLYAVGFLALTLLSGVWLRAAFVRPSLLGPFGFGNALHAHSHLAFFGWTSMALFALITSAGGAGQRAAWLRWHAHATGAASAAAFIGFLLSGYTSHTIALSALHVALWVVFAAAAWRPLRHARPLERSFYRAALAFLVFAGVAAMAPAILLASRISDPWLNQLAVQGFLTPFVSGWLMLGAMGASYGRLERPRWAAAVLVTTAFGVLPSTLLHTRASPPADWLLATGHAGTLLVGIAAALFAVDVLRARRAPAILRLVGLAAAAKAGAELFAGAGLMADLLGSRQLLIAYLHLVLLGIVTPLLLLAVSRSGFAERAAAAYAAGVAAMLGALLVLGWPAAGAVVAAMGVGVDRLLQLALLGGALSTVAALVVGYRVLPAGPIRQRRGRVASPRESPASPDGAVLGAS